MAITINGTTGIAGVDGSASTPAVQGADTNTGVFFPAADTIAFAEGGAEAMRIDSNGNVGIGTTSPQNFSNYNILTIDDTTGSGTYYRVNGTNTFRTLVSSGGATLGVQTSAPLMFETADVERGRFTSGGYFKASNSGSYLNSTGTYHELRSDAASSVILYVNSTSASYAEDGFQVRYARNTTNNTFNAIVYYNSGVPAAKFVVADSGNVTNTNGSYGTISDVKLKQDITDATPQWDDIKNLRFRKYRLKSEVELDLDAKPFLGLVAQEAELICPGLIEEHRDTKQETKTRDVEKIREITPAVLDDKGNVIEPAVTETYIETEEYIERVDLGTKTKVIKTSILYMKAVKALQEAMARIEILEAQNAAFEARLAALEAK